MPAPRIRRGDLLYDPALHCIGEGSTAIVFKAEWLGANVAVKALKFAPSRLTNNLDSFHREAERISTLRHPNIIHFYGAVIPHEIDHSDEEKSDAPQRPALWIDVFPVLVFEYAPLGSLAQYLAIPKNRESLSLQLAYRIASQIANGMCYLHTREPPIIHGELRPTNVLLMSDFSVKLADFGFSKVNWTFTGGNALNSASLSLAGAMRYMAPERLEGNTSDAPADVYSFAMTLYELFGRGKKAFELEKMNSDPLILAAVLVRRIRPSKPNDPSLFPNLLWTLVESCWADSPQDRPPFIDIAAVLADPVFISNLPEGVSALSDPSALPPSHSSSPPRITASQLVERANAVDADVRSLPDTPGQELAILTGQFGIQMSDAEIRAMYLDRSDGGDLFGLGAGGGGAGRGLWSGGGGGSSGQFAYDSRVLGANANAGVAGGVSAMFGNGLMVENGNVQNLERLTVNGEKPEASVSDHGTAFIEDKSSDGRLEVPPILLPTRSPNKSDSDIISSSASVTPPSQSKDNIIAPAAGKPSKPKFFPPISKFRSVHVILISLLVLMVSTIVGTIVGVVVNNISSTTTSGMKGTNIISVRNITLADPSLFVTALALSPDGKQIHVASSDFLTSTFDAATGNLIRTYPAHSARVRQIASRPDNTLLLTASDDRTARIYDMSTGALVSTFATPNTTFLTAPNGGGFRAAALTNTRVYIGDVDGVVREYSLDNANSTLLRNFTQHTWAVNTIAVTTDGRFMYSGSDDTFVYKYDLLNSGPSDSPQAWKTMRPNAGVSAYSAVAQEDYYTTPPAGVLALALFKELYVYALGTDNAVHVFNAEAGTKVGNFSVGTGASAVRTVAVGKNATTGAPVIVSAGNDKVVRVWDGAAGVAAPREVGRVEAAHAGPVTCVGVSPDMRYFVTAGEDAVVRMWAVV